MSAACAGFQIQFGLKTNKLAPACGHLAFCMLSRGREQLTLFMKRYQAKSAFTLVEIMIVVAIIGLLAAMALPSLMRARTTSQMNACINNLKDISNAMDTWAAFNNKITGAQVLPSDIKPYLGHGASGSLPCCPCDPNQTFDSSYGSHTPLTVGGIPACTILPLTHICPYAAQGASGSSGTGSPAAGGG